MGVGLYGRHNFTGERPPTDPPRARAYAAAGMSWSEYSGDDLTAIVAEIGAAKGEAPLPENESVVVDRVIPVRRRKSNQVREMSAEENSTL